MAASFVVGAGLLVAGCPPPPGADGGPSASDAGPQIGDDAGRVVVDAGDPVVDAGPVITDADRALTLCLLHRQGERNAAELAAPLGFICDPQTPRSDSAVSPAFALNDPTLCLPAKPLFQRYLNLVEGESVAIDWDALTTCQSAAQDLRAQNPAIGDNAALVSALTELQQSADCQAAITGLLPGGASCAFGLECAGDLLCEPLVPQNAERVCTAPAMAGEACAFGTDGLPLRTCAAGSTCYLNLCAPPRQMGQMCGNDQPACADGLTCGPDTLCVAPALEGALCTQDSHCAADGYCQSGTCKTPITDGQPCASGERCASACSLCRPDTVGSLRCQPPGQDADRCAIDVHCLAPRYCDDIDMITGLGSCTLPAAAGEACDAATPCGAALTCRNDIVSPSDAGPEIPSDAGPVAPQTRCFVAAPVGAPCSAGTLACAAGICFDGTCVAGVLNDPCANDNGCTGELLCEEGACVEPPREGAPCSASGRCDVELYCADTDRCRVFPPAGEMCAPGARCDDAAYCVMDMCEAKKGSGVVCAADNQCHSDICLLSGLCAAETSDAQTRRSEFLWLILLSIPLVPLARRRIRARKERAR